MHVVEIEHAFIVLSEDTIIKALFKSPAQTTLNSTRAHGKRHYSVHITEAINEA